MRSPHADSLIQQKAKSDESANKSSTTSTLLSDKKLDLTNGKIHRL